MTFYLPQKTRILWLLRMFFAIALLCLIIVDFCDINSNYLLPTAILVVIASAFLFIYVYMYTNSYEITFNNTAIVITKGVIIKTTIIVPCRALAYVKSLNTPVMAWFGLTAIILKVTRGWIFLPEIDNRHTQTLLQMISNDENDD